MTKLADTDPWAPDPIPATLPRKPYTLPTIGADPWPRDQYPDDLDTYAAQFEKRHGSTSAILHKHREEEWAQLVADYEANPQRFAAAWRYLDAHPIFYRFRYAPEGESDPAAVIQERHLLGHGEFGLYELYFKVSEWCAQRCDDDDCAHPKRDICWLETGPSTWPPTTPEQLLEYAPEEACSTHDYRLDVYGDTYESCIVQLAHRVWTLYGNDRALDGTANQFEDEEGGA